jgi:feruloyl esterase
MSHCAGGAGPATFDTLTALEQWVEQGIAPDQILAIQYVNNDPTQGRPENPPSLPLPANIKIQW